MAYTGAEPDADDPLLCLAPYIHPHPRSNSITPERQRRFIATLAATGIVTQAARESSFCLPLRYMRRRGKSMEALYRLRAKPGAEGFAAAWGAALEGGAAAGGLCAFLVWPAASHLEANRARARSLASAQTFRSMTLCQVCQAPALKQQSGRATRTHKPDNALLRFLLQHRLPQRYGVDNPGHTMRSAPPVYESIRRQVLEQQRRKRAANEQAVFASIDRKLALIRERYGIAEGDGD